MLIVPLFGRSVFRNPPVVTLAIILVNVLIFFFFQSSGRPIYEEARDLENTVSCMYLHGGLAYLLGNMIFLWLVGYVLELVWGRALYTVLYVLGGMCVAALFWLACPVGMVPLVGASGGIAALMGAYAVLCGRRKVKVVYSLGFFLDHAMVPGSVILALWVGSEILQLCLGTETQAVGIAHLGGFGVGVAMGLARQLMPGVSQENSSGPEPDTGKKAALLLDKALMRAEKLDTKGARYLLGEVLKLDSHNRTALTRKYHLDKVDADCDDLCLSAGRLLDLLVDDRQAHLEALAVYREYIRTASRPRLPLALLFSLSSYFAATGHLEEAEKIMGFLLKKRPDLPKMPRGLLHLARACLKDGLESKARGYLQVICMRYPLSGEFTTAQLILDDLDGGARRQL